MRKASGTKLPRQLARRNSGYAETYLCMDGNLYHEGNKTMKYIAPRITDVSAATSAIQSGIEKGALSADNVHPEQGMNATAPGYEADE